jgi:hypothetical protein
MPDLTKLPVPQHQANQPYHWSYDNLPLKTLADRDEVINNAVNKHSQILNDAAGTQGNLANRLDQSIDENGNLKSSAVNESMHNIAEHTDGTKTVEPSELTYYNSTLGYSEVVNPVPFVRMLGSERDKLSSIPADATSVSIEFCTDDSCSPSNVILFDQGRIQFQPSPFITWEVGVGPNTVKPVLNTSLEYAHRHYYDIEPELIDEATNEYDANGSGIPYIEGSLRVYLNGIRLSSEYEIFYPKNPSDTSWASSTSMVKQGRNMYTPDHSNGKFTLLNSITENDVIRVDFDIAQSTAAPTSPTTTPTVTPTPTPTPTLTPTAIP